MPISTFELLNIPDCNSLENLQSGQASLNMRDTAIFFTEKGREKILGSFANVPFDFKFYMLALSHYQTVEQNRLVRERAREIIAEKQQRDAPESICVLLTNNATSRKAYMPFTPWILGHRFGHLNLLTGRMSNRRVFELVKQFALNTFKDELGSMFNADVGECCFGNENHFRSLCYFLITGKAARDCNLVGDLEVFAEMTAQYLVTGKITLVTYEELLHRINFFLTNYVYRAHGPQLRAISAAWQRVILQSSRGFIESNLNVLERQLNSALPEYVAQHKGLARFF
jgi:hypothetical protein